MKNLLKRVMSIAAATALLMTSVISASAADGHGHRESDTPITGKDTKYTITLTKPAGDIEIKNGNYGAYQIFTGEVKNQEYTSEPNINPGSKSTLIPITDIKWGNAFGNVNSDDWQNNIVNFVIALADPYLGENDEFKSAFADFNGFNGENGSTGLAYEAFASGDQLADRFYKDTNNNGTIDPAEKTNNNVNFDKLATEVADVVAAHNDREWLQAFTDILGGYGKDYGTSINANKGFVTQYYESQVSVDNYTIGVPESGYYMILDRTDVEDVNEAFSARMLFVVNNVNQVLKEDIPKLHKAISRNNGVDEYKYETEAAGVGDEVDFRLTGTLPSNYDQYTLGYQFIFTDKLSKGLTLKGTKEITSYPYDYGKADASATDFVVKVKGVYKEKEWIPDLELTINLNSITSGTHTHDTLVNAYSAIVNTATDGQQTLTVTFPCLKEISITGDGSNGESGATYTLGVKGNEKSEIYIDYTAVVNENAIVSPANGNKNTAKLTYSDNPQSYADTDDTTPDNATVYTFGLDIVKVDAAQFLKNDGNTSAVGVSLSGAEFILARPVATTLGGDGNPDAYTEWELATFTFIDSTTADAMDPKPTVESFVKNGYYSIVSWTKIEDKNGAEFDPAWVTSTTVATGTVQGNAIKSGTGGYLNISGLNDGVTYTIAETKTPEPTTDYAKIEPFTIKLTAAKSADEYTGKLSAATSDKDTTGAFSFDKPVDITDKFEGTPKTDADGSANMLVANFKYTDLPSTGGIGVYIYYIAGGCAVVLALVLFALSKKKRSDK